MLFRKLFLVNWGVILFIGIILLSNSPLKAVVVLNVQVGEEIRYLDPQLASGLSSAQININIFSGLYQYHNQNATPVNDLAISHTKNITSSEWTFKLRKDVYWISYKGGKVVKHRPVTAHDVVYSYQRILSPKLASEYAYMLYIIKNAELYNKGRIKDKDKLGVIALDDYTVRIILQGPVPSLISYLPHHSFGVVPREPIEKFKEKWVKSGNLWSSGPFTLKEWKLKERLTLVKNPYYRGAKNIQSDTIHFRFIGHTSADAVRAFKAGEIDIDLSTPPAASVRDLLKSGHLKVARQLGTYFLRFNTNKKPFDDERVRKALSLAIPRKQITKYITKVGEKPIYSLVPSSFTGYNAYSFISPKESFKKRIQTARDLLKQAGYEQGKGFPKFKYLYNTSESHQKIAVLIAKTWEKELGIKAEPINQEWKVYLNQQNLLNYDVCRAGWIADMEDPMNFLELFITDGGNNNTGFSDTTYDDLISKARIEGDLTVRNRLMEKAEKILMKSMPIAPVFEYTTVNVVQKYIKGFYANKMDQHLFSHVKIDLKQRKTLYPHLYQKASGKQ